MPSLSHSFAVYPGSREQTGPPFEWGTLELAFVSCASQKRLSSPLLLPASHCQLRTQTRSGQGEWAKREHLAFSVVLTQTEETKNKLSLLHGWLTGMTQVLGLAVHCERALEPGMFLEGLSSLSWVINVAGEHRVVGGETLEPSESGS